MFWKCFLWQRSNPIPPIQQVLAALWFYATGFFYSVQGDLHNISVASVCRIIHGVTQALVDSLNEQFFFPSNRQQTGKVIHNFYFKQVCQSWLYTNVYKVNFRHRFRLLQMSLFYVRLFTVAAKLSVKILEGNHTHINRYSRLTIYRDLFYKLKK